MEVDEEGFEYPCVDYAKCVNCSLCNKVCPVQNAGIPKAPLKVYAAQNLHEETRAKSSSGGVFTPLAETVINDGGVVFGASFDKNWNPVHSYTEQSDGLVAFRGSKYVQSRMGTSYTDVQQFLKAGRKVLFSGTSCQVAGLKRFLGKEYANLFTVEILCHGVPSPKVWQRYLETKKKEFGCDEITEVNFRNKQNGWFVYNVVIAFGNGMVYAESHKKDAYFRGFMKNMYLRPSCYACKCKNGRSGSDVVIADYWCINDVLPGFNDKNGTSLVLVNTEKGLSMFASIADGLYWAETGYVHRLKKNGGFAEALRLPLSRKVFFGILRKNGAECIFRIKFGLYDRIKAIVTGL
ncbi:MAG: Coenzyme F420 hydrogenase/dehydrogenase, beta subunit C-terminal domain [Bacteroides sp.]|nr:Coenzyme F420 hydrogenase/dehydrogenase, beta subunit C-terminal domain [Bacteroides sp.]